MSTRILSALAILVLLTVLCIGSYQLGMSRWLTKAAIDYAPPIMSAATNTLNAIPMVHVTESYSVVSEDAGKLLDMNCGRACTVELSDQPVGTIIQAFVEPASKPVDFVSVGTLDLMSFGPAPDGIEVQPEGLIMLLEEAPGSWMANGTSAWFVHPEKWAPCQHRASDGAILPEPYGHCDSEKP